MKKILSLILALGFVTAVMAIPAKPGSVKVKNSDGTTLTISLRGDESFHFYVTEDGIPVRQNEQGDWVKDERDVNALWQAANARRNEHRFELAQRVHRAMKAPRRVGVVTDEEHVTKKGLLILVNFSDVKFKNTSEKTHSIFSQMVNGIDNPYGKNRGSVREYFRDQSYHQFDIEFDVVGPVTVSKTMKYYGENDSEGNDKHPEEMVIEAIQLVDGEINFADYDWDGDGEVENIYVTYAGYGEAYAGSNSNTIWPHQWQLSQGASGPYRTDNVQIDTYACGSELYGVSGSTIEGIGTMCHEYSHCLGLPDFYDIDYKGNVDMADWSLMASGCNNNDGFTPCSYTAYERWFSGWLEPKELTTGYFVTDMKPIEDEPEAYIIYNDNNHNEYYMLANHQKKGWDIYNKGHGMMILHVDYSKTAWYNNRVNTTKNHPRMAIIPADNELKKQGEYYVADAGDLWPGTKKKTALTDSSTPAASLYNANTDGKKFMHKPITAISEANGLISFTFMGGESSVLAPTDLATAVVSSTGFTAQWGAVEGAVSYNLTLTEEYDDGQGDDADLLEAIRIYDNFANFYMSSTASADGNQDLKSNLDTYTLTPGWTGEKIYRGLFGAKLGTSSAKGYITTPSLHNASGKATAYINALDWFNYSAYMQSGNYSPDGSSIDVILQDATGNELQKKTVKAPDAASLREDEYPEFIVSFKNVPELFKICISTTTGGKRIYLQYVIVFDGNFILDQINTLFSSDEGVKTYAPTFHRQCPVGLATMAPKREIVSTTTQYVNIRETSYVFTNLKPGAQYTYVVQAVDSEGKKSAWSNPVTITLPEGDDAIMAITSDASSNKGAVYDLSGRRHQGILPRGIYIRDGRKFVVR